MSRFTCLLVVLAFGCSEESPSTPPSTSQGSPASSQPDTPKRKDAFREKAKLRVRDFETKLKSELMAAMKNGGPANAVEVCSKRAPAIAEELSTDKLLVRRIGTRVRNPNNRPDEVDQRALGALSEGSPTYHVADPKRFYRAIFAKPLCLGCHGSKEALAPDVRPVLARIYPKDEATGYAAGDLRGAFVVESRSPPSTPPQ